MKSENGTKPGLKQMIGSKNVHTYTSSAPVIGNLWNVLDLTSAYNQQLDYSVRIHTLLASMLIQELFLTRGNFVAVLKGNLKIAYIAKLKFALKIVSIS